MLGALRAAQPEWFSGAAAQHGLVLPHHRLHQRSRRIRRATPVPPSPTMGSGRPATATRGGGAGVWGGEACRATHNPAAAGGRDLLRGARVGSEFDACQVLDPGGSAAPQRYGWIPSAYSAVIAAPRSTPIAAPIAVPSATPGRFESPRVHRQLGLQGREQLLIRRITGHPQRLQAGEELREGKL